MITLYFFFGLLAACRIAACRPASSNSRRPMLSRWNGTIPRLHQSLKVCSGTFTFGSLETEDSVNNINSTSLVGCGTIRDRFFFGNGAV